MLPRLSNMGYKARLITPTLTQPLNILLPDTKPPPLMLARSLTGFPTTTILETVFCTNLTDAALSQV
jgi:hypothetical protein